ncbi:iron chelate uptake ABC transporter family permease subunit [uncultured Roseovarius sp.]|uniref:iron chelate uptake ABC transporter family permease subunit n=1 Tax=uncultured Roseovarius sp. TaxID=293344 RepID=UPI002610AD10|nr:iron chelate uptake ABC transporter family permease subunit [uncultured Roseovarius sp.]
MPGKRLVIMTGLMAVCMVFHMTLGTRGSWDFVLPFRGTKLAALLLVAVAVSTSTLLFQTVARNRILTPSIMGFDALYVLIVTLSVFAIGAQSYGTLPPMVQFFLSLAIMVAASMLLFGTLLLHRKEDIVRMILTGIILGVLFRAVNSFVMRMIDPNEYSVIQTSSYARFSRIETDLLGISAVLVLITLALVWRMRHRLDVLALGREAAINLGEDPRRDTVQILLLIAVLVSVSTAFVGPVAFLGLLVTSLTHVITPTAHHAILLPSAALISAIALIGGQTLLEHGLALSTPLAVVIDSFGGILFLFLILKRART